MNSFGSNQPNINPEILHLMKSGQVPFPFLKDYIKELQQPDYPMDFVTFMDQMIDESGMDRKTIIARSGLSESLAYKYLNGNKKIQERDYILALCIAMRLTFPQTQHALRCSGLPLLGTQDLRAIIIRMGIEHSMDRYQIDECLTNQGLPLIRISSDMPSAEIKDSFFDSGTLKKAETNVPAYQSIQYPDEEEYEKIESSAKAQHCGNAPFDFNYFGSMTLRDDNGNTYHLRADYLVTGETYFCVMNEEQYEIFKEHAEAYETFDSGTIGIPSFETEEEWQAYEEKMNSMEEEEESEKQDVLELYFSLLDATASKFFPYFLELDHLTDLKVAEVMAEIDDTRNYPYRVGSHWNGQKQEIYIEMFNSAQPERREYFQMIEDVDHECTFTASHESYFMQIEMNDLYGFYFKSKKKQEYFIQATNENFDKLDKRYRMIFNNLRHHLHEFARKYGTFVKIPDEQFYAEESEFFAELFVASMHAGDIDQAKRALAEQENAINASSFSDAERLLQLIIVEQRKHNITQQEGNQDEAVQIRDNIISRKQDAIKLETDLGEHAPTVFTVIADMLLNRWRSHQKAGQDSNSKEELTEILELMKHGAFSEENESSQQRFEVYQAYAYQIDQTDPDTAEEYYKKAIKEATKHHLDQNLYSAAAVPAVYNNYAWVLWNKFGSEEAIIHYGRAIELTETYLENGMLTPEQARRNLTHYGAGLLVIYRDTGRKKEHDRLYNRLVQNGVTFDEE